MINFKTIKPIVAAFALTCAANVGAVPFTSDGVWTGLDGNPSGATVGLNTNHVQWGEPFGSSNAGPSGYIFDGRDPGEAPLDGTLFDIGDFTHENFTINLPSITGADLDLSLDFGTGNQTFGYFFEHVETPNDADPCAEGGSNPCPDKVSIPDAASSSPVTIDGNDYILEIAGFSQDGGANVVSEFLTEEGQPNVATLYARLVLVPQPVPEPSVLALLATGLLGAWRLGGRRRA